MSATSLSTKYLLRASAILGIGVALGGCDVGSTSGTENAGTNADALSANEKAAYEYFVGKGLKNYQAAGIVGNLIQESSVNPAVAQYGGGPGRGIAQWSVGGRWDTDGGDNVAWFAAARGESRWALNTQLDFIWYELTHFSGYGLGELESSGSLSAATIAFEVRFEGCGQCNQSGRIGYAQQVLNAYGNTPPAPPPKPDQAIAPKPTGCGEFKGGEGLGPNESVKSCDGRFELVMQTDGNLVLYMGSKPLWASNTYHQDGYAMWMQTDGNFVLYNPYRTALWAAGTYGHPGSVLRVQNDGNLVVYEPNGKAIWDSGTWGH